MPEGVEVHIQTEGLKQLIGDIIVGVHGHEGAEVIIRPMETRDFADRVTNKKIKFVYRIGKNIIFEFEDRLNMVSHLRMTGRWLIDVPEREIGHSRITFHMSSGKALRFSDVRKFGKIDLMRNVDKLEKGVDALLASPQEMVDTLLESKKAQRLNLKTLLNRQDILAGIGNVYANETLWRAGYHPARNFKELTREEVQQLVNAICLVLGEGYKNGGLSLKDYYHVDGTRGEAQNQLKAYNREICDECDTRIIYSKEFDGRATYYCPSCQG